MRDAMRKKWENEVRAACPDIDGEELERRVKSLQQAHMQRMTLKAAQAKRRIAEQKAIQNAAQAELAEFTD